jgi:hypothetical protein
MLQWRTLCLENLKQNFEILFGQTLLPLKLLLVFLPFFPTIFINKLTPKPIEGLPSIGEVFQGLV